MTRNNYRSWGKVATDDERRIRLLRRCETSSSRLGSKLCNDIACRQLRRIFISPATLSFSTYSSHSWLTQNTQKLLQIHTVTMTTCFPKTSFVHFTMYKKHSALIIWYERQLGLVVMVLHISRHSIKMGDCLWVYYLGI